MSVAKKKSAPKGANGKPALDPYRITHADFIAGAASDGMLPAPTMAEIAFAGRSNVGKSSLINALVNRKSLVRTSSTPGATRQVNLFEVKSVNGATFHLVDLPGYGYAQRSKAERKAWGTLIESYLSTRVTLAAVVLILDVRRGVEPDDLELIEFVEAARDISRRPVQVVIVATKIDKLPKSGRKAATDALAKACGRRVIPFSAVSQEGRDILWKNLRKIVLSEEGD